MKVLLIGLGNMGTNHRRVIQKVLQNTVHEFKTCDSNSDKKADYLSYKEAIKEFKPSHVVIAAPTIKHEEILNYCIDNNVQRIFIEKPITDNQDAIKYLQYWDTNKIMVGHIERFNPIVAKMVQELQGKEIDTIICTRSGFKKDEPDYSLHYDLCIHDADVCQLLTRHLMHKFSRYGKGLKSNSANLFFELNGVDCFLHADNKSPYKRRDIKVMGPNYFLEGDYLNQKLFKNGIELPIEKVEPLYIELHAFFNNLYTKDDLEEAIFNLKLVGI